MAVPDRQDADGTPMSCAATYPGVDAGAITAKVFEHILPTVVAGLTKLVELVKKLAAPI